MYSYIYKCQILLTKTCIQKVMYNRYVLFLLSLSKPENEIKIFINGLFPVIRSYGVGSVITSGPCQKKKNFFPS